MTKFLLQFFLLWLLVGFLPIFAIWTMGVPHYGLVMWFSPEGLTWAIGWVWVSILVFSPLAGM